jgi:hypothetical protein
MPLHKLLNTLDQWLTPLKIILIFLSGMFGSLGLLTNFRNDRTKKITRWGWVSLIGIVLSTTVAIATQYLDSADTEKQTRTTLLQLQRGLSSLEGMELHLRFKVPCDNPDFNAFCSAVRNPGKQIADQNNFQEYWKLLPDGGRLPISYSIHFFTDPAKATDYIRDQTEGDMRVHAFVIDDEQHRNLSLSVDDKQDIIIHTNFAPSGFNNLYNGGRIFGKPDLSQAAIVIDSLKDAGGRVFLLMPHSLGIIMKDGEQIYTADNDFEGFKTSTGTQLYCGFMPRQSDVGDPRKSLFECPHN